MKIRENKISCGLAMLPDRQPIASRQDLDNVAAAGCSFCGDASHPHEFYFHSGCHPDSGIEARYLLGIIVFECAECRAFVAKVEVK